MSSDRSRPPLPIAVVHTGTANIASIVAGLQRAGAKAEVTEDPAMIRSTAAVVLPGVGSLRSAMRRLRERGLVDPLRERIDSGLPTLAICLGMQLLFQSSEESPGETGLAIAEGEATRFSDVPRVPQMGWNAVRAGDDCQLLTNGVAYFANSYRITNTPRGWNVAHAEYGGRFTCAMERGCVLACQFHPELSGEWGRSLLRAWVNRAEANADSMTEKGSTPC